ncbi:MAG: hypothetical protein AW10_00143 [Candidatus Accumulibacter appositus]|uniref:Uncharacterized protein n=1 Tax=Candidatus Accumulibacter appositus TaxID=1454003 RepID=A0A011QVK3_9PROT|nr:MAG: hypothetical protein AW10_00143 [Candidatus Accumulibacter appositus]
MIPSAPRPMSSKVIGCRSGPGSTTLPTSRVPATAVRLTVLKVLVSRPPPVPLPSASRKAPSCWARIAEPLTCSVICEAPGKGLVKNNQAKLPSSAGTMLAAILLPSGAVAYKLSAVRVAVLTAREKFTCGRKVTPTSCAPLAGVTLTTVKAANASTLTVRVRLALLPAASLALRIRV